LLIDRILSAATFMGPVESGIATGMGPRLCQ
jgi:hypothetical protein